MKPDSDETRQELARQDCPPETLDKRSFLFAAAGIVIRLAITQMICALLIRLTGLALLRILFYAYAAIMLLAFLRKSVAGTQYTLYEDTLVLTRIMGGGRISEMAIPLDAIKASRPYFAAEDLRITYRNVTYLRPELKPSLQIRAAFLVSILSAKLSRTLAGKNARRETGCIVVYRAGNTLSACVFDPEGAFAGQFSAQLKEKWNSDDRTEMEGLRSYRARLLQRAFPGLYPHVLPLISKEEERAIRRRKRKNPAFFQREKTGKKLTTRKKEGTRG